MPCVACRGVSRSRRAGIEVHRSLLAFALAVTATASAETYEVNLRIDAGDRTGPADLESFTVTGRDGALIPLAAVAGAGRENLEIIPA